MFIYQQRTPVILRQNSKFDSWYDLAGIIQLDPFAKRQINGMVNQRGFLFLGTFIEIKQDVKDELDLYYYAGFQASDLLAHALLHTNYPFTLSQITF